MSTASQMIVVEKIAHPEGKPIYHFFKRIFDIFASFFALVILFLPMCVVALAIKAESEGPAIYKQERLGLFEKPFVIYKFRSMYNDAEKNGAKWATKDDPRITKVGAFLRKTRMDEFPQLVNILLGQMTIVGPRPERPVFYDEFDTYIDGFRQRTYVKPGLTGFAQVNGGYDLKPEEKVVYDLEYIRKQSFWLDLKIIFKTVSIVFSHKGAR